VTRKSRRELERALEELGVDDVDGERPPELTPEEKEALAELLDVDTDDIHGGRDADSEVARFLDAVDSQGGDGGR
jgi:hypothetical protein